MDNNKTKVLNAEFTEKEIRLLLNSIAIYITYLEDTGEKFKEKHTESLLMLNKLTLISEGIDVGALDNIFKP